MDGSLTPLLDLLFRASIGDKPHFVILETRGVKRPLILRLLAGPVRIEPTFLTTILESVLTSWIPTRGSLASDPEKFIGVTG
jgi:hypothetical protein